MFRIRKLFRFEAAHQLDEAFSKACADCIHGHSYVVEVFLTSTCLDNTGMVLDFGVLKEWIDAVKENWDHALLLSSKMAEEYMGAPCKRIRPLAASPTAEVMAATLADWFKIWLQNVDHSTNGLALEKIRVHETVTGWAEWEENPEEVADGS